MSYKIDSYKSNILRIILLFSISGTIIYFFILEDPEKEVINHWLGEIQKTAFYGIDLCRDLFNKYIG